MNEEADVKPADAADGRIDPYGGPHAATANLRPSTRRWPPTDGSSILYGTSPLDPDRVWFVPESTVDALIQAQRAARSLDLGRAPGAGAEPGGRGVRAARRVVRRP